MIMWKDVYLKGLKYVYQLFQRGQFKSFETVYEEFGLTKLRYNSLRVAIPQDWKSFLSQNSYESFSPLPPHNYDLCISVKGYNLSKKSILVYFRRCSNYTQ